MAMTLIAWMRTNLVLTLVCVSFFGTSAVADINLVFGTYAADKPSTTVKKFKPFLDHLADQLSSELNQPVKIKMKIAKAYDDSIKDLVTGSVDFARFGPASYITAKDQNPDIQIIAMELKKGNKRFNGVIAVHAASQISSLSDLKGQSFAFGDELSTIGRYLSQSHLLAAGVKGEDLESYSFLGRHDLVGSAVGNGKFAAGALKESTFKQLVSAGEPLKALFEFENVTKPWLASSDLSEAVATALRDVMLNVSDPQILGTISKDGFSHGMDEDYDFVRKAMILSEGF